MPDRAFEGVGRKVDDAAKLRRAHVLDRVVTHVPVPFQVHVHDQVEVRFCHVPNHALAQDTGAVDNNVDLARLVHYLLHHAPHRCIVAHRVEIGDSPPTGSHDFIRYFFSWFVYCVFTITSRTRVIDDDRCPFTRQQQRNFFADTPACPRDDCRTTFKIHYELLLVTDSEPRLGLFADSRPPFRWFHQ